LRQLKNDELARLILRKLWQIQDVGGVSMGRSLRNVFLEAAKNIMPCPEMPNLDAFSEADLKQEGDRRKPKSPRRLRHSCVLKKLSDRTLAILLLLELKKWLDDDALKNPHGPLGWEIQATKSALRLLPLPKEFDGTELWSADSLVSEARDRYSERLLSEENHRFKKELKARNAGL
jgi:hypothetical protein